MLLQASLTSGAFALVPAPLAPLLAPEGDAASLPNLHGDPFELGMEGGVEEFLEGGADPRLSIGSAGLLTRGSLSDGNWQIEVLSGRNHTWTEASGPTLRARWRVPQVPTIAMRVRRGDRLGLSLEQREGSMRGAGELVAAPSEGLRIRASVFHSRDRGSLEVALADHPRIPIEWSASRTGAEGMLEVRLDPLGRLRAGLGASSSEPLETRALYVLRTEGSSADWTLRWDPAAAGPWIELSAHDGRVRSTGSVDTAGSSRDFHHLLVRSSLRRSAGGWAWSRGRAGAGWSRAVLEIPPSSYFTPFLSWNTFNPSAWAPVEQILSDQREHLGGTLEVRHLHTEASWDATRGRARLRLGAVGSWWALEPGFLLRTTRMSFLGAGYRSESVALDRWRLRAWTLAPSFDLSWDLGAWGELSADARATLPLAVRRLGPPRPSIPEGDAEDSPRGLWNAGIGWRRSF